MATNKTFHLSQIHLALKVQSIAKQSSIIALLISLVLVALSFRTTGILKRCTLLISSLTLLYVSKQLADLTELTDVYDSASDKQSKQGYEQWLAHSFKPVKEVELTPLELALVTIESLPVVKFAPIETALKKPHLMILGETGSGKSTIAKFLLSQVNSAVVVIDPHAAPNDWVGFDVVGAGRNYEAIAAEFERLESLMQSRYEARDKGVTSFQPLIVIIDEFPAIASALGKNATTTVKLLAREARKVQIRMCLLSQGAEVKTLGLEGEGSIRESFAMLRLGNFALGHAKLLKDAGIIEALASGDRPAMLDSHACNLPQLPESQALPVLPMPSDYLSLIGGSPERKQLSPADVWDEPVKPVDELAPVLRKIINYLDGKNWKKDYEIKASIREFKDSDTPLTELQGYLQFLETQNLIETRSTQRGSLEARTIRDKTD